MTMRRITIVTGANSGVGFGICQRLLSNLCHSKPSDAQPQKFSLQDFSKPTDDSLSEYEGITLIMACRSVKRAESAKERLYSLLDAYIEGLKANPDEYIHAKRYRENVDIRIHALDLAVMNSVFQFAEEIVKQYPYVTDLICNAGLASFSHVYWFPFIAQLVTEPMAALTTPKFYRENQGELSVDGLGWVWQCNVFAHYCIFRVLQSLLKASPMGGRVVWTSSLAASPSYESEDWQLIKTEQSYEGSKYQIELMATHLDFRARKMLDETPSSHPIRHFISEPGICSTNFATALVSPGSRLIEICLCYIVRFLGSVHHTIKPYKAAVSSVHLILAPLWFFALSSQPLRYGAETDRWGKEYVGLSPVKQWDENCVTGEVLLNQCEALYQKLRVQERGAMDKDSALATLVDAGDIQRSVHFNTTHSLACPVARPSCSDPEYHSSLVHSDAQKRTIYALSTPPGKGGVAVIRVSGPEALEVWKRMVRPHISRLQPTPWRLERCQIVHPENPNEVVDDGMSVFFKAPRSFTTEPTLELHTHSGKALLAALLNALSRLPFLRPAEPGEFTRRAFLSGRLDLTQVEGLADLIDAETEEQRKVAGRGTWGQVRGVLDDLRVRVIKCLALVEALIDFGEGEDLEEGVYSQARKEVENLLTQIQNHLADNRRGEIVRSGINLAIYGPPNAGKSSLLNYLAQREAAIVTSIPGTTRDVLQLTLDIGGMPVVVTDTAGLRKTDDLVEKIGIKKGIDAITAADVSICVLSLPDVLAQDRDVSNRFTIQLPETIRELASAPNTYYILNKADLPDPNLGLLGEISPQSNNPHLNSMSQLRGNRTWILSLSQQQGTSQFLEGFGQELHRLFSVSPLMQGLVDETKRSNVPLPIITRARHRAHLESASAFLQAFLGCPPENIVLAAEELRYASRALGKISGSVDTEEILDAIFRTFCIGK